MIDSAELSVSAVKKAINGKDSVTIQNSTLSLQAGTDGICADNTTDSNCGFVSISDSELTIRAGTDGIQAETALQCRNVRLDAICGGGSQALPEDEASHKGLKAGTELRLDGGSYSLDCPDDCIHSNGKVLLLSGSFTLSTLDDGIHADEELEITDGTLTVTKSDEALESSKISISGGVISLTASDDGINAVGKDDKTENERETDPFESGTGEVEISGGYLMIDSKGDGMDSNGSLLVSGGVVLISGPENGGNGALDFGTDAKITGGVVIALGSAGMAQGFTSAENQGAILCGFDTQQGGTSFALCGEDGKAIVSFTPKKPYQTAAVSAPELQTGGKYRIVTGATVTGADENGFAQNAVCSGGNELLSIEMTQSIYAQEGMQGVIPGPGGGRGRPNALDGEQNVPPDGNPPTPPAGDIDGNPPMPPDGDTNGNPPTPPDGNRPEPPEGGFNGNRPQPPDGSFDPSAAPDNG